MSEELYYKIEFFCSPKKAPGKDIIQKNSKQYETTVTPLVRRKKNMQNYWYNFDKNTKFKAFEMSIYLN